MPSPSYPVYLAYNKSLQLKNVFYQFNTNGIDVTNIIQSPSKKIFQNFLSNDFSKNH